MEMRVQFKICEGCGCIWYRGQAEEGVYCRGCIAKLGDFPSAESRKRRGRPAGNRLARVWAVAEAAGGGE